MTNNDLPYKTGNSTPYSVTAYMGKEPKKKKCISLTESLCNASDTTHYKSTMLQ